MLMKGSMGPGSVRVARALSCMPSAAEGECGPSAQFCWCHMVGHNDDFDGLGLHEGALLCWLVCEATIGAFVPVIAIISGARSTIACPVLAPAVSEGFKAASGIAFIRQLLCEDLECHAGHVSFVSPNLPSPS